MKRHVRLSKVVCGFCCFCPSDDSSCVMSDYKRYLFGTPVQLRRCSKGAGATIHHFHQALPFDIPPSPPGKPTGLFTLPILTCLKTHKKRWAEILFTNTSFNKCSSVALETVKMRKHVPQHVGHPQLDQKKTRMGSICMTPSLNTRPPSQDFCEILGLLPWSHCWERAEVFPGEGWDGQTLSVCTQLPVFLQSTAPGVPRGRRRRARRNGISR